MGKTDQFDIIIAGAGAAGLSLLWFLLNSSLRDRSILITDRSFEPVNDKTWCFWADKNIPYSDLIYHSWSGLEVKANGNVYSDKLEKYGYHCIRSIDHFKMIYDLAKKHTNVTILESDIKSFSTSGDLAKMDTSKGRFTAPWIFQSAIKPPALKQAKKDISLMQHFIGWEIETDTPLFNPNTVTLMDFDVTQKNGVSFMYELPFGIEKALIEYTLFSGELLDDEEYETELRSYIKEKYGLTPDQYRVSRKEKGVIPMEDTRYPGWYCNRVMNIGKMGGLTKPTTGYTFTRIHKHCVDIVRALENGMEPPVSTSSSYRFRVYDIMLLYLLQNHHQTSIEIFNQLFRKNRFDDILRFLEEESNLGNELSIFSSLPYMPFFKAIYKMKHRIFTGA